MVPTPSLSVLGLGFTGVMGEKGESRGSLSMLSRSTSMGVCGAVWQSWAATAAPHTSMATDDISPLTGKYNARLNHQIAILHRLLLYCGFKNSL